MAASDPLGLREGVDAVRIDPGKPSESGVHEGFNGEFRDACLNLEWFRSRPEARVIIETSFRSWNHRRPYSNLGCLTPREFTDQLPKAASERAVSK